MDINHILVKGCPYCEFFLNPEENVHTKLYYPGIDDISTSDFIVVDSTENKVPQIIIRDHVTNISSELWGKILYICRKHFGSRITLKCKTGKIKDHWNAFVISPKKY